MMQSSCGASIRGTSAALEVLAIIPARGGSKGVPRKNLQRLAGKPLLVHTIEHARSAPSVTRICVSTDDQETAAVAGAAGAEVIPRPAEISGDTASSEAALLHALDHLACTEGYQPDLVVFLQCTSPVRQHDDIQNALGTMLREDADSLLSVVPFHVFVWQVEEGVPRPLDYDPRSRPRRQDRKPEYLENGSIYIFKPWVLREQGSRLGGQIALYVMDEWSSLDVNTSRDMELGEWLMARLQNREHE